MFSDDYFFLSLFCFFLFFSNPLLFPEEVCSHNAEALLNAIRQKSSLLDGTRVPALWIKNDPTNAAWTNQQEKDENSLQTHGVFIFYDSKNLYLKKKMGIIGWIYLKTGISQATWTCHSFVCWLSAMGFQSWETSIHCLQVQPEIKGCFSDLFFGTKTTI